MPDYDDERGFNPDWQLDAKQTLRVHLSLLLDRHVPKWPGATDEQLEAVANGLLEALGEKLTDGVECPVCGTFMP